MSKGSVSPQARDRLAPKLREKSNKLKQLDLFYKDPLEDGHGGRSEQKPEDCVPDLPENSEVREFLKSAPTKGLWMPLGKEVKVMQCWRCKQYGHRTGDKECTLASKGNLQNEQFRKMHEDPMYHMMRQKHDDQDEEAHQKELRIAQMKAMLEEDTSGGSDEDSEKKKKKKKKKSKKKKRKKSDQSTEEKDTDHGKKRSSEKKNKKKKKRRLHPSDSEDSKD
ncbi:retinitis pigmentosa 9 protein homolog [Bolinopsis microptera]|uniref:retinitis pigmentosa 9 protein homolog n=1 Tax=Bolinopsis microptera TaxID=2820187 RepID=UPI00307A9CB9